MDVTMARRTKATDEAVTGTKTTRPANESQEAPVDPVDVPAGDDAADEAAAPTAPDSRETALSLIVQALEVLERGPRALLNPSAVQGMVHAHAAAALLLEAIECEGRPVAAEWTIPILPQDVMTGQHITQ